MSPGATVFRLTLFQSPVLVKTVLPHQDWIVFRPIVPFSGYSRLY